MTASLVASGRNAARDPARADTDENGRFALEVPSAGNWQLTASAHNIRSQQFDEHEGYFTGVILTAESPTYDLVFYATPDAILRGIVTDEAGEPVRNAQLSLFAFDPAARLTGAQTLQQHQGTQTDDRGYYEFASLDPGAYMVQVQARPWYASSLNGVPRASAQAATPPPDPSLDVVYSPTWYPGVTDSSSADVLTAHPGDRLEADFRLSPVPSAHLLIPSRDQQAAPPNSPGRTGGQPQPFRQNPNISLLLPNGTLQPVFGQFSRNEAGDVDIGGLAPGSYQVTMPGFGPESPSVTSVIHIGASGSTTELGAAPPTTLVTISVDGGTNANASQVVLRSTLTGQSFSAFDRPDGEGRGPRPPGVNSPAPDRPRQPVPNRGGQPIAQRSRPSGQGAGPGSRGRGRGRDSEEIKIQIPPGSYDVSVPTESSVFVTGITAKGATAAGRTITLSESSAALTVHLASGLATVDGVAVVSGKPAVSAMVLLIPATLGDASSITVVRRDQTNTDGSFRLADVIPGQYILLALEHGWAVRWTDPETLRPYLMHGTPLELRSSVRVNPKVKALVP